MTLGPPRPQPDAPRDAAFRIEMSQMEGVTVIRLIGSCAMDVAHGLDKRLQELADAPAAPVVVDLSNLRFIESTGLGYLIAAQLRLRKTGGEIRLAGPTPSIRKILTVTRLTRVFRLFDDVAAAADGTADPAQD